MDLGLAWSKHAEALSWILDDQLDGTRLTERQKCRRRERFMRQLNMIHAAAFNGTGRRP